MALFASAMLPAVSASAPPAPYEEPLTLAAPEVVIVVEAMPKRFALVGVLALVSASEAPVSARSRPATSAPSLSERSADFASRATSRFAVTELAGPETATPPVAAIFTSRSA